MPFFPSDKAMLLSTLFNRIPDTAIVAFDSHLSCLYAGGDALKKAGFDSLPAESSAVPFFSPDQEILCREILAGECKGYDVWIREAFFRVYGWPVQEEGGPVTAGILLFQDRTEAKKSLELLEQRNTSLKEALSQVEEDKQRIKKQVTANIQNVLLPMLEKLKVNDSPAPAPYVVLIEKNLKDLTSAFGLKIAERFYRLTPKEIQICSMIKNGLSSREIGRLLNISEGTIESHRNHIRRKLDIAGKTVNLATYLQTFDGF